MSLDVGKVSAEYKAQTGKAFKAEKKTAISYSKEFEGVAKIEISSAGKEMARMQSAKATLEEVTNQIKEKPEIVSEIHSTLRAQKINHLLFD